MQSVERGQISLFLVIYLVCFLESVFADLALLELVDMRFGVMRKSCVEDLSI